MKLKLVPSVLAVFFFFVINYHPANNALAGSVKLLRTGQSACRDSEGTVIACSNTGQDGDIRAGVIWRNPRFTRDRGKLADNLTGLVWTEDANTPGPDSCGGGGEPKTWYEALDYVKCLNADRYLGHGDWRLPNVNELESLVNYGRSDAAAWLNAQGFAGVQAGYYWSSTTYGALAGYAWSVNMSDGRLDGNLKSVKYSVFPVRTGSGGQIALARTGQTVCYGTSAEETPCGNTGQDGSTVSGIAWPQPRFTEDANNTITDNLTGLVWTKDANIMKARNPDFDGDGTAGDGMITWQSSLDYIKKLNRENYLGHDDWRLPNIRELRSLVNYASSDLAEWLQSEGYDFSRVQKQISYYWSSSSDLSSASQAWRLYAWVGHVSSNNKSDYHYLWPVRGGFSWDFILGDINGDRHLSLADAIIALKIAMKVPSVNSYEMIIRDDYAGSGIDVNGDKRIGLAEAIYILQTLAEFRDP